MKTINNIIENSALGLLNTTVKYAVAFLFAGIMATVLSLLVFMLKNSAYVSASFNF